MGGGGEVSRNGGLPYYIEVSLDIPHDTALEKNLHVLSFLR